MIHLGLSWSLIFSLTAMKVASGNSETISVTNGEKEGTWGERETCPSKQKALGFEQKVEESESTFDGTAVNGIKLICGTPGQTGSYTEITSQTGKFGDWKGRKMCKEGGVLQSFWLRVDPPHDYEDDEAVTNIKFVCSTGEILEGEGEHGGEYGDKSPMCLNGIIGLKTLVQPHKGFFGDDTSLNDVIFYCSP
ncbi:vitelline membrane outer layer protein 1 homolog [Hyperolius riggenbachi]|uniref:vitelline membrane outer layer protein 1 homolog n=1 Tax=Hyperolius riggenbachi TaxID=752182 RepID=UPI0035A2A5B2